MRIETKLAELGLVLPAEMRVPPGFRISWRQVRVIGNRAIIAGHGPRLENGEFAGPAGNWAELVKVAREAFPDDKEIQSLPDKHALDK